MPDSSGRFCVINFGFSVSISSRGPRLGDGVRGAAEGVAVVPGEEAVLAVAVFYGAGYEVGAGNEMANNTNLFIISIKTIYPVLYLWFEFQ